MVTINDICEVVDHLDDKKFGFIVEAITGQQPDLNATLTSIAEKEVTYGNY